MKTLIIIFFIFVCSQAFSHFPKDSALTLKASSSSNCSDNVKSLFNAQNPGVDSMHCTEFCFNFRIAPATGSSEKCLFAKTQSDDEYTRWRKLGPVVATLLEMSETNGEHDDYLQTSRSMEELLGKLRGKKDDQCARLQKADEDLMDSLAIKVKRLADSRAAVSCPKAETPISAGKEIQSGG